MKIGQKTISIGCVIVILVLVFGKMEIFHYKGDLGYGVGVFSVTERKIDQIETEISQAQQKLDSIKREKRIYIDGFDGFVGTHGDMIGVVQPLPRERLFHPTSLQEYVMLGKIGLKIQEIDGDDYLAFYTKNGKSYLSRTKLTMRNVKKIVSHVDKQVNYKYSSKDNSILVPINSGFWKACIVIFSWGILVPILALCFFILFTFFKFIISISKNNIFEEGNIQRLKDMSIALLILGTFRYVFQIIIYLLFSINHPLDGVIITYSFWENDYFVVILAVVCYLIYTAFKKGMVLQQEQDLTI